MFDSKNRATIDAISRIRQNRLADDDQNMQNQQPITQQPQNMENTTETPNTAAQRTKSGLISNQTDLSVHRTLPTFRGYVPPGKSIQTDINPSIDPRIAASDRTSQLPVNYPIDQTPEQRFKTPGSRFPGIFSRLKSPNIKDLYPQATPETEKRAKEFNSKRPLNSLTRMLPDGRVVH